MPRLTAARSQNFFLCGSRRRATLLSALQRPEKRLSAPAHPDTATMRGNLAAIYARRRPPGRIIERLKSLERWSAGSAQTELVGSHYVFFNNILLFCTSDGRQIQRQECRYPSYFATALSSRRGRVPELPATDRGTLSEPPNLTMPGACPGANGTGRASNLAGGRNHRRP